MEQLQALDRRGLTRGMHLYLWRFLQRHFFDDDIVRKNLTRVEAEYVPYPAWLRQRIRDLRSAA